MLTFRRRHLDVSPYARIRDGDTFPFDGKARHRSGNQETSRSLSFQFLPASIVRMYKPLLGSLIYIPTQKRLPRRTYTLARTLDSCQGAILCLGSTEDGSYLAAGGTGGTTLWNLSDNQRLTRPAGPGQRGATTVLMWIRRTDEPREILYFGTQNGYIVCWKQLLERSEDFEERSSFQLHNPGEITGIDFDSTSNRLAVANRNGTVVLFSVESPMVPLGSISIQHHVPKTLTFGEASGNRGHQDLLVFGLGGRISILKHQDEKLLIHATLEKCYSGHAAITTTKDVICVDDPAEGAAIYKLQDGARVRTFAVPVKKSHRPRQVAFGEDGKVVVSGSDHGVVYVYERRTGLKMNELKVDLEDWVQALATMRLKEIPCIMAARSRELGGNSQIYIWEKGITDKNKIQIFNLKLLVSSLMCLATLGFVYQNIVWIPESDAVL
ncbi:WD40-repeat-containing domain protein [Armillaria luteobubalina]|uniref:WD40-repeat-containing domain protein n=1 Tax=Armillaria luteobubalina TaxID=153913 RepID=A0AA39UHS2_9AGAR|nr:WD40-repeat-containing domain protein [Armillaria luteobubalina]